MSGRMSSTASWKIEPGTKVRFQTLSALVHRDDLPAFHAGFTNSLLNGADFDQVFRIVTAKGRVKYLHAVSQFVAGAAGRAVMMGLHSGPHRKQERRGSPEGHGHRAATGSRSIGRRPAPEQDRQLHLGPSVGPARLVRRILSASSSSLAAHGPASRRCAPGFIRTTCSCSTPRFSAGSQGGNADFTFAS